MRSKGPNPVDLLVGARIRVLRKRSKMSQAELGKALGVTFQQVQKYENGKNRVGAGRLHLVSTTLDVPISEFFAGASETSRSSFAAKSRRSSIWWRRWRGSPGAADHEGPCGQRRQHRRSATNHRQAFTNHSI
jgi:DNA-binding XRE family transcriptional regulator